MVVTGLAVWALGVVLGAGAMLRYERTPGVDAPVAVWPSQTTVPLEHDRRTVVLLVHPKCPCTRSTMRALGALLAESHAPVALHALVFQPRGAGPDWGTGPTVEQMNLIPGLDVHADVDGVLAHGFGVRTSGTVLVFDPTGTCLFAGGITAGRGHEGENPGLSALRGLLQGGPGPAASFPAYGCSIDTPSECTKEAACPQ